MTKRVPRDAAAADFAGPWADLAAQGAAMMYRLPLACALCDIEGAAKEWQQFAACACEAQSRLFAFTLHLVDTDAIVETASSLDTQH